MKKTCRGAIRGTSSFSEGGGAVPLMTASAALCTACFGSEVNQPRGPRSSLLAHRAEAGAFGDDGA